MPQLDISTYFSQVFWLLLTFGALYLVMWQVFLPKIGGIIHKRDSKLAELIALAEELKAKAKGIEEDIAIEITNARKEAKDSLDKSIQTLNKKFSDEMFKLEQDLAKKTHESEEKANIFKQQAFDKTKELSVNIAEEVLSRLLNQNVDKKTISTVVESAQKHNI